jgi:tRNA(Ile)-lysidine synthase
MSDGSVRAIEGSVQDLLDRRQRLVVAVSGGIDSAVLLHAIARHRGAQHRVVVACVDHGTGPAATEATARVLAAAAKHGLSATSERLAPDRPGEAAWRAGRWAFLRSIADGEHAPVVTAHTRDDHIETVVMRILRGAGARGLAGLFAPSPVERPMLHVGRSDIVAYAKRYRVEFIEDPTNASRAFLRNRVRLDLLPAIRAVAPGFEREILTISRQASELRTEIDQVAEAYIVPGPDQCLMALDALKLGVLEDASLRVLLPALVSKGGVTLDRRGLARLVEIVRSSAGTRAQLSGGFEAVRGKRDLAILLRPTGDGVGTEWGRSRLRHPGAVALRATGETLFGGFRFLADPSASFRSGASTRDPWRIYIPKSTEAVVRQWNPGDRLTTDSKGTRRRVKRFFADAGVVGPLRVGWPVVVCGDDVVWIPGVRSSQEAIPTEGRMVQYRCERLRG